MLVYDGNSQVVLGLESKDGKPPTDIKVAPAGDFITVKIPLELEENGQKNAVGTATLYIDDSRIQRELRAGIFNTVIRMVVMLVVLQFGISYLIGKLVTRPLNAILTRMKDIAEGEGDLPMPRGLSIPAKPTLAVSREPAGGSPTGSPTGPGIIVAPAQRAS